MKVGQRAGYRAVWSCAVILALLAVLAGCSGERSPSGSRRGAPAAGHELGRLELPIVLPGTDAGAGPVVARVAGIDLHEEAIDRRFAAVPEFTRHRYQSPEGRLALLEGIIDEQVLLLAAIDEGIQDDPEVRRALSRELARRLAKVFYDRRLAELVGNRDAAVDAYIRAHPQEVAAKQRELEEQHGKLHLLTGAAAHRRAGIEELLRDWVEKRVVVSDEEVRAYYDSHAADYRHEGGVLVRQIALDDEHEAAALRRELVAIADRQVRVDRFIEAAKKRSTDRASAARGGRLGVVPPKGPIPFVGDVPEIRAALFATPPGELTAPLSSPRGVHIFLVEKRVPPEVVPLEVVAERIRTTVYYEKTEAARQQIFKDLRRRFGVEIFQKASENEHSASGSGS